MISTNIIYNGLVSDGANFEWQILNNNTTIGKGNIIDGSKIESSVYERISVGNCIASQLHLTLWNATIDASYPLEVQFRAVAPDDGSSSPSIVASSWYTKGIFYVDTMERSLYSENIEIKAFDSMLKTETDFMPTGSYVPMTALAAAQTIATDIGVSLESNTTTILTNNPYTLSNAPNVGVGGTTDREMLSYIGTIYGGNWVITADNKLKLILAYESPSNTVNIGNAVSNFMASEVETVKRVKLWLDSETYYLAPTGYSEDDWLALGGRCLEIKLPFYATQALATSIYTNFSNKSYYPYKAQTAYVDPKYEVGDGITIVTSTPVTSVIASQTITVNPLASSELEFKSEEKLDSLYPYISSVERTTLYEIGQAKEAAEAAASSVGNANYREQLIYISKASGTTSMSANTTWVTNATGNQNTWTTKRPVYSSSYPVLFVATQRQSVEQSSGTSCSCTTPVVDQTTTVIDGGHITTGTIDAGVVNVTNINASNIETGTLSGVTISGNTISGNTITGGTISGTTITGSTLTSATANGSVRIADGSIDFFKNATTTGTPFSQIKHVVDSSQGDSIEWTNSGYTKLVNTGGGQWTANFVQFALNANNPQQQLQIYSGSDGTHTKVLSNWFDLSGSFTGQRIGTTTDYDHFVVGLCKSYNGADDSWWSGRIVHDRPNGVIAPYYADVTAHNKYASGNGWVSLKTDVWNASPSKNGAYRGWSPCTFIYGGETYAGIEGYFIQSATIYALGGGSCAPFAIPYYDTNSGSVLNSEIYNSISFTGASEFGYNPYQKWLYSGTLPNTATTISGVKGRYKMFYFEGKPSNGSWSNLMIPEVTISTTEYQWELADNQGYRTFKVKWDGDNLVVTGVGSYNGGTITGIAGL